MPVNKKVIDIYSATKNTCAEDIDKQDAITHKNIQDSDFNGLK